MQIRRLSFAREVGMGTRKCSRPSFIYLDPLFPIALHHSRAFSPIAVLESAGSHGLFLRALVYEPPGLTISLLGVGKMLC